MPTTLGLVWIAAHRIDMAIYVTNLVTLIGIGIAIDYSLLIVHRFRDEMLERQRAKIDAGLSDAPEARLVPLDRDEIREALRPTMEFAGHSVVLSGLTVAVGLAGHCLVRTLLVLPPDANGERRPGHGTNTGLRILVDDTLKKLARLLARVVE